MINRKIISGIFAVGLFTGSFSGIVSADNYEREAEFICPYSSTLVPGSLLEKFNFEKMMNDKLCSKALELELYDKNFFNLNLLVKNEVSSTYQDIKKAEELLKKMEEVEKNICKIKKDMKDIKNSIDNTRKDIKKLVVNNNLSDLIPFFPWTNIKEIRKIISEKEPNFFNVGSLALNTDYINDCFEGIDPNVEATVMCGMRNEYEDYDRRILLLKRALIYARRQEDRVMLTKNLASLWIAENILEKEIIKRKLLVDPLRNVFKKFLSLHCFC